MGAFDTSSPASAPLIYPSPSARNDHGTHVVQFYVEDAFLIDELSQFVGGALGGGGAAIVICTKSHEDGLTRRLKARGFDISKAVKTGRYVQLDADQTLSQFMVDGWPDPTRFAEVMGRVMSRAKSVAEGNPPHIAAFGEMVAVLWAQGMPEAAIQLEQLWNDLSRVHSFTLRCAYPITGFSQADHSGAFATICAQHSGIVPDESYTALPGNEERDRTIARLQQKAIALETEMEHRKQIEEELRRSKAELESLVRQRTAALRRLSSRLLGLQDSERRRLARELHDTVGQYLMALKLNVGILKKAPEREDLWSESEDLMKSCISEVRTLSHLLHPPTMDEVGFASAAQWYVKGFGERSGLKVKLNLPDGLVRMPPLIELTLFRVLQESLTNVHRHAGASNVDILLQRSTGHVMMEVKDDGNGMPQELAHQFPDLAAGSGVGLMSMRERAVELGGAMHLESGKNGTSIRITMPLDPGFAH
jgi:signal transduction histidine kinase